MIKVSDLLMSALFGAEESRNNSPGKDSMSKAIRARAGFTVPLTSALFQYLRGLVCFVRIGASTNSSRASSDRKTCPKVTFGAFALYLAGGTQWLSECFGKSSGIYARYSIFFQLTRYQS